MKIEYRYAEASDVQMLARMHQQSVEEECKQPRPSLSECAEEINRLLIRKCEAIIFQAGEAEIGYALFQREPEGVFLRHFFVSRQQRRQGIGRTVMQWLLTNAWHKPNRVRLAVHVENQVGVAFWRAIGFSDWLLEMKLEGKGIS